MKLPELIADIQKAVNAGDRKTFESLINQARSDPRLAEKRILDELEKLAQRRLEFQQDQAAASDASAIVLEMDWPALLDELAEQLEEADLDLLLVGKRLEELQPLIPLAELGHFDPISERYKYLRSQRISELKKRIEQAHQMIEEVLKNDDEPEKHLALPGDPVNDYEMALRELKELMPTDAQLGTLEAYLKTQKLQVEQVQIYADYHRRITDLWEKGKKAEQVKADRGTIKNYYQQAASLANMANSPEEKARHKLTRTNIEIGLSVLQAKANELYQDYSTRHEDPSTRNTIQEAKSLVLSWQRQLAKDSEAGPLVSYFKDEFSDAIIVQSMRDALDIALLRLRAMWKTKVIEYIETADQWLADPNRGPGEVLELLGRVDTELGIGDPDLNLDLQADVKKRWEVKREDVRNIVRTRQKILDLCGEARSGNYPVEQAWPKLQEAESKCEAEQKQRKLTQPPYIPEIAAARRQVAERTLQFYDKLLEQAQRSLDKGRWDACQSTLQEAANLELRLPGGIPAKSLHQQRQIVDQLETLQSALARLQKSSHLEFVRDELLRLYDEYAVQGGEKYFEKWSDFRELQTKVAAYFDAEKQVAELTTVASLGGTRQEIEMKIQQARTALVTIGPNHRPQLQVALQGLEIWLALRQVEQDPSLPDSTEKLNRARGYEPTRGQAEQLYKSLEERRSSQTELARSHTQIGAYLAQKQYRRAYDLAKQSSKKFIDRQHEFNVKVAEIQRAWETAAVDKIETALTSAGKHLNYIEIQRQLDDLRYMEAPDLLEYLEKAELPAKEAEAKFILSQAPPKSKTWAEVIQACDDVYAIALQYGQFDKANEWAGLRLEQRKKQVLAQARKTNPSMADLEALEETRDLLENLNNEFQGEDGVIWLELGKVYLELGKRENKWT